MLRPTFALAAFLFAATAAFAQVHSGEMRLSPSEYKFPEEANAGTGSSGVAGIRTIVVKGDPNQAGLYTILLRVPPHTRIAAHSHRDDRVATVISGTWHFGYGDKFDQAKLKTLPPGSFYTEPPNSNHFAETGDEPVVVQVTGFGPSRPLISIRPSIPATPKSGEVLGGIAD